MSWLTAFGGTGARLSLRADGHGCLCEPPVAPKAPRHPTSLAGHPRAVEPTADMLSCGCQQPYLADPSASGSAWQPLRRAGRIANLCGPFSMHLRRAAGRKYGTRLLSKPTNTFEVHAPLALPPSRRVVGCARRSHRGRLRVANLPFRQLRRLEARRTRAVGRLDRIWPAQQCARPHRPRGQRRAAGWRWTRRSTATSYRARRWPRSSRISNATT